MRTFTQAWANGDLAVAAAACLPVIVVMAVISIAAYAIARVGGGPE